MKPFHPAIWLALACVPSLAHAQVRSLSTDRPDRTESAYTVPAGWVQVESDFVTWGRSEFGSETATATSVFTINAKYGVTSRLDVQLLFSPWERFEVERTGFPDATDSGSGQAGVRVKYNLFGNDGGGHALALLPFAVVPTRGDDVFDSVTWGMVAPVSMPLGDRAGFGAMVGFTRPGNEDTWVVASVSVGSAIAGDFSGFVELFSSRSGFESDAVDDATIDAGVTFAPGDDWQLDAGVYRGLASETEDWRVFVGASARFPL